MKPCQACGRVPESARSRCATCRRLICFDCCDPTYTETFCRPGVGGCKEESEMATNEKARANCEAEVWGSGAWQRYRCSRKEWAERPGSKRCKQHHPETMKARAEANKKKADERYKAERERAKQLARRDAAVEVKRALAVHGITLERVTRAVSSSDLKHLAHAFETITVLAVVESMLKELE